MDLEFPGSTGKGGGLMGGGGTMVRWFIDFAPQVVEEARTEPPAKRVKQASIAAFFQPKASGSSSSSSSSQGA